MPRGSYLRRLFVFSLYSLLIAALFLLLLSILSSITNSWIYFNTLSEKTGLSVSDLKDMHYGFVIATAALWAFDAYKRLQEKHRRKPMKTYELIDHHTMHILKLAVLPFLGLIILLFIALGSLLQTYGPLTYELRTKFPNDPTVFEFFSLIESVILAIFAVTTHIYLLRRFFYWVVKK